VRLWATFYGDKVNVVLNDKGGCSNGQGNAGTKNCEAGVLYTRGVQKGPKNNEYHSTNIFAANNTWLWEYADLTKPDGTAFDGCGSRGPTVADNIAHDLAVRDYLTALVGPPPNPCLVENGGCDQVCTDIRGEPVCSCTGRFQCDNCNRYYKGCVEGHALQAKGGRNAGKCVQRKFAAMIDTKECNRTNREWAMLLTFQDGQLISRADSYKKADTCLQVAEDLESTSFVKALPCDAALPSQKWECLGDGSIRHKGTQDVFLRTDRRQCNSTKDPDTCTLEELKWNAYGSNGTCTFCQAAQALCGEGAERDKRRRGEEISFAFIATPSGALLLALAALVLPLLQGA